MKSSITAGGLDFFLACLTVTKNSFSSWRNYSSSYSL